MASSPGTPDLVAFFTAVCSYLGVPTGADQFNLAFFLIWAGYENTAAAYNPLADEQDRLHTPGAVQNTPGTKAWSYPDLQSGAANTAAEMQAITPTLISFMAADNVRAVAGDTAVINEINTWGTHGFANLIATPGPFLQKLASEATSSDLFKSPGDAIASLPGAIVGALGQGILYVLTQLGHGIAGAARGWTKDLGSWARTQVLALAVAGVVLYVLLNG
jgi:hypothetical protein